MTWTWEGDAHVVVRPALARGEHRVVHALLQILRRLPVLPKEYQARPRSAERLVRRRRDHVAELEGVRELARGDEPGRVRDVGHEEGAVLVGGLAQGGVVPVARVGGGAADDEAGLEDAGLG